MQAEHGEGIMLARFEQRRRYCCQGMVIYSDQFLLSCDCSRKGEFTMQSIRTCGIGGESAIGKEAAS
jgi:hypothetical protein